MNSEALCDIFGRHRLSEPLNTEDSFTRIRPRLPAAYKSDFYDFSPVHMAMEARVAMFLADIDMLKRGKRMAFFVGAILVSIRRTSETQFLVRMASKCIVCHEKKFGQRTYTHPFREFSGLRRHFEINESFAAFVVDAVTSPRENFCHELARRFDANEKKPTHDVVLAHLIPVGRIFAAIKADLRCELGKREYKRAIVEIKAQAIQEGFAIDAVYKEALLALGRLLMQLTKLVDEDIFHVHEAAAITTRLIQIRDQHAPKALEVRRQACEKQPKIDARFDPMAFANLVQGRWWQAYGPRKLQYNRFFPERFEGGDDDTLTVRFLHLAYFEQHLDGWLKQRTSIDYGIVERFLNDARTYFLHPIVCVHAQKVLKKLGEPTRDIAPQEYAKAFLCSDDVARAFELYWGAHENLLACMRQEAKEGRARHPWPLGLFELFEACAEPTLAFHQLFALLLAKPQLALFHETIDVFTLVLQKCSLDSSEWDSLCNCIEGCVRYAITHRASKNLIYDWLELYASFPFGSVRTAIERYAQFVLDLQEPEGMTRLRYLRFWAFLLCDRGREAQSEIRGAAAFLRSAKLTATIHHAAHNAGVEVVLDGMAFCVREAIFSRDLLPKELSPSQDIELLIYDRNRCDIANAGTGQVYARYHEGIFFTVGKHERCLASSTSYPQKGEQFLCLFPHSTYVVWTSRAGLFVELSYPALGLTFCPQEGGMTVCLQGCEYRVCESEHVRSFGSTVNALIVTRHKSAKTYVLAAFGDRFYELLELSKDGVEPQTNRQRLLCALFSFFNADFEAAERYLIQYETSFLRGDDENALVNAFLIGAVGSEPIGKRHVRALVAQIFEKEEVDTTVSRHYRAPYRRKSQPRSSQKGVFPIGRECFHEAAVIVKREPFHTPAGDVWLHGKERYIVDSCGAFKDLFESAPVRPDDERAGERVYDSRLEVDIKAHEERINGLKTVGKEFFTARARLDAGIVPYRDFDQLTREFLSDSSNNGEFFHLLVRATARTVPRAYDETKSHPALLVFEHFSQLRLRQEQVELIGRIFPQDGVVQNVMIALQPGKGKTKVALPLIVEILANGERIAGVVVPDEQFDATVMTLDETARKIFGKRAIGFGINFEKIDAALLQELLQRIERVKRERLFFVFRKSDLVTLELLFRQSLCGDGDEELAEQLHRICREFWLYGAFVYDDAHMVFSPLQETRLAFGQSRTVPREQIHVTKWIFQQLYKADLREIIGFGKNRQLFVDERAFLRLRERLADAWIEEFGARWDKEIVGRYLRGLGTIENKSSFTAEELLKLQFLYEQLAFFLFECMRGQRAMIDYCPPDTDTSDATARPVTASSSPIKGAHFSEVQEEMNKTLILFSCGAMLWNEALTRSFVEWTKELSQRDPHIDERVRELIGTEPARASLEKHALRRYAEHAQKAILEAMLTEEAFALYLDFVAQTQLEKRCVYEKEISVNPCDLAKMTQTKIAFTGTLDSAGNMPDGFERIDDGGITVQAVVGALRAKNPQIIQAEPCQKGTFSFGQEGLAAIIDLGALYAGFSAECVAENVLKEQLNKKGSIRFWNAEGVLQVAWFEGDRFCVKAADPHEESGLTIYLQRDATGRDLAHPVDARALVTVSRTTGMNECIQALMRMRQFVSAGMHVDIVIGKDDYRAISNVLELQSELVLSELLLFFVQNDAQRQLRMHYTSHVRKMHSKVIEHFRQEALLANSVEEARGCFESCKSLCARTKNRFYDSLDSEKEAILSLLGADQRQVIAPKLNEVICESSAWLSRRTFESRFSFNSAVFMNERVHTQIHTQVHMEESELQIIEPILKKREGVAASLQKHLTTRVFYAQNGRVLSGKVLYSREFRETSRDARVEKPIWNVISFDDCEYVLSQKEAASFLKAMPSEAKKYIYQPSRVDVSAHDEVMQQRLIELLILARDGEALMRNKEYISLWCEGKDPRQIAHFMHAHWPKMPGALRSVFP